jgi:hypothetical protein
MRERDWSYVGAIEVLFHARSRQQDCSRDSPRQGVRERGIPRMHGSMNRYLEIFQGLTPYPAVGDERPFEMRLRMRMRTRMSLVLGRTERGCARGGRPSGVAARSNYRRAGRPSVMSRSHRCCRRMSRQAGTCV